MLGSFVLNHDTATRAVGCSLLTSPEELRYLLHFHAFAQIYQRKKVRYILEQKTSRKERSNLYRGKGKKEGGRDGRKEGLAPKCCVRFPIFSYYFQRFAGLNKFTSVNICNCRVFARFGIMSENRVVISRRSEQKNCTLQNARGVQKTKKTQNIGAKFNASHSLCNILKLSLVNRVARAAF